MEEKHQYTLASLKPISPKWNLRTPVTQSKKKLSGRISSQGGIFSLPHDIWVRKHPFWGYKDQYRKQDDVWIGQLYKVYKQNGGTTQKLSCEQANQADHSSEGRRVNPIRIESCESFTRAKAFMSKCVAITNDSSGSRIIKCE